MATFIWDSAVQWPPPAHILLGYDVVAPDGVLLSSRRDRRGDIEEESMTQPYLALITPLTGSPDQGLPPGSPGSPSHPWVPPGNYPDQGLPPGSPGAPSHPIYHPGHPDHGRPSHPIAGYPDQGLPGGGQGSGGRPSHPIAGYPDQGLPGGGQGGQGGYPSHPINIPGIPDQGLPPGTPVPPGEIEIPEPPEEYADDLVVAVHKPGQEWQVTTFPVQPDQGQPAPSPH